MELTDSTGKSVDPVTLYSFEVDCIEGGAHDYGRTREKTCHNICRHRRCRTCGADRIQYHVDLVPSSWLEACLNHELIDWNPVMKAGSRYCRVHMQTYVQALPHASMRGRRLYADAERRGGPRRRCDVLT